MGLPTKRRLLDIRKSSTDVGFPNDYHLCTSWPVAVLDPENAAHHHIVDRMVESIIPCLSSIRNAEALKQHIDELIGCVRGMASDLREFVRKDAERAPKSVTDSRYLVAWEYAY